jgi:RNA polymerase sigma factor (sigma-70 family)
VDRVGSEKTKVTPAISGSRFDEFYTNEFAVATRLAHLLTGRDDVAEDLVQDAMARIHGHFDDLDNPAAYLRTTLVNLCRSWHRGALRERDRNERIPISAAFLGPEVEEVLAVVDRLPYRQRAVIVMRYWLDLSETDIAEHLGCRPGTVKSLSSRAVQRLERELQ